MPSTVPSPVPKRAPERGTLRRRPLRRAPPGHSARLSVVSRSEPGSGVPTRTCVGCRERAPKAELLRVVVVEGECVPDPRGRLPGRGAHLHPRPECLTLALRRRAFSRALRVSGPLGTESLQAFLGGSTNTSS
ncbi:MAG TPA: YlxR family protein [Sporichthya sp.]|nr:YlxR family protein [Sporichthya sp.]